MSKSRVAVIFGGVSSEHDISLKSASFVINNIPRSRYEVVCIGITKSGRWLYYPGDISGIADGSWRHHPDCAAAIISPDRSHSGILKLMDDGTFSLLKIDCVFPVLHGKNGEDGTIQGLLAVSGIPYVGCDTLSSANCMDKEVSHILLKSAEIKTADYVAITLSDMPNFDQITKNIAKKLDFPIFVKPANAGSSVGVNKAEDLASLKSAIKIAFTHDNKAICERTIVGREIECAVLGTTKDPESSILGEISSANDFYDFDSKYILNESQLYMPARIDETTTNRVRDTALRAFKALGCFGLARVDFFVTDQNEVILNEINTIPGFTEISMYPKLWEKSGIDYANLLSQLIDLAVERVDN